MGGKCFPPSFTCQSNAIYLISPSSLAAAHTPISSCRHPLPKHGPGGGGDSGEMCTCSCPVPSWPWGPWGPRSWLPGCCQSTGQVVAASTAALCSQETPFCWDTSGSVLTTLLIRTQCFCNSLPHAF